MMVPGMLAVAMAIAAGAIGRAQTAPQDRVFQAGVTLVTTDLIVRDASGQFVSDLAPDDLTVYEDDVAQEVASLVLINGGRVFNRLLPPAPVQEGIVLPGTGPVDETAGRVFILFVDDMHLDRKSTPKVRQVFKEIVDTLIHEGDLVGVISSGPSALNVDLTYDRATLYDAMDRIVGDGLSVEELIESTTGGGNGPMELRWRVHKAFKLARDIVGNLERMKHRRKAFIYISAGYDFNPYQMERIRASPVGAALLGDDDRKDTYYRDIPDERIRLLRDMTEPASGFANTDLAIELADLARAANRANASFHTVDPRGMVASAGLSYEVPLMSWNAHMNQTQFTMRFLADLTGGIALVNTNNFAQGLRRIDAEMSDYYVVGFYSDAAESEAQVHRLRVEVNRPGVSVRHRTHYMSDDTAPFEVSR
jgi:VWFA-related protein